ncbi:MAG: zf-HC2 domain-containing protein [Candidatus Methylomirabilales bacterium]
MNEARPPVCRAIQALVPDLLAGELEPEVVEAVEGHAGACAVCGPMLAGERLVRDLVRARASRPVAPASLRERVSGLLSPRRGLQRHLTSLVGSPGRAAAASAALVALLLTPFLYFVLPRRDEPIQMLAQVSLTEHVRAGLIHGWRAERADRKNLLPYLRETLGLPLERLFDGDPELELMEIYPSVVMGEKGVAILYRDRTGRTSTLLVLPGRGLEIPARNRMQIETFRPYLARADRHNLLIWKQGDVAYSLVSEQEEAALARVYLKIRKAP